MLSSYFRKNVNKLKQRSEREKILLFFYVTFVSCFF